VRVIPGEVWRWWWCAIEQVVAVMAMLVVVVRSAQEIQFNTRVGAVQYAARTSWQ
jgi:hypothetical protein